MALPPDMLQEYFEQAQKCKISWKIKKIETISENQCISEIKILVKWKNYETHFMNATLLNKECTFDSYYKPFFEGDLKTWNQIEYILDEKNYNKFQKLIQILVNELKLNIIDRTDNLTTQDIKNSIRNINVETHALGHTNA